MTDLHELEAIKRLKYKYMRCLDQKRWEEMAECFTEDATAAYSGGKYSFQGKKAILVPQVFIPAANQRDQVFVRGVREHNEAAVRELHEFGRERGLTPGQLLVAWVLAKEPRFTPLIGAKTVAQLEDALGALGRPLSAQDLAALDGLAAIRGDRYSPEAMHHLDSER